MANMTAAAVLGPLGAIIGIIAGAILGRPKRASSTISNQISSRRDWVRRQQVQDVLPTLFAYNLINRAKIKHVRLHGVRAAWRRALRSATLLSRLLAYQAEEAGDIRVGVPSMYRVIFVLVPLLFFTAQAEARHRHYHHSRYQLLQAMASIPGDERIVSNRPSGCPSAFCGCEASLYRFGRVIPQLNLASNWFRFPRAAPAPGMAAVRSGHVMILQQQVSGNVWNVHDGNSGGHVTREHPRSIAGYTIVDPSGGSSLGVARAGQGFSTAKAGGY
jgi:hypothetical protein